MSISSLDGLSLESVSLELEPDTVLDQLSTGSTCQASSRSASLSDDLVVAVEEAPWDRC
jgi:hypothetical protein